MFCATALACALFTVVIAGPLCYQCDNVTTPSDCHKGVQCSDSQRCFTQKLMDFSNNIYYKLGCENANVCQKLTVSLIGKRDVLDQDLYIRKSRQATHMSLCLQCCVGDGCNNKGGCVNDTGMLVPTKDPGTSTLVPTHNPVDGGWTDWSVWSQCSKSCGSDARKVRARTCSNPPPQHGSAVCYGNNTEVTHCQAPQCPIDGTWSEWEQLNSCPGTCGSQVTMRHRRCDNPAPQYHGANCSGTDHDFTVCHHHSQCPVDGGWGSWLSWNQCSQTCGAGSRSRARDCDNPKPADGGNDCHGDSQEHGVCNNKACPGWSGWFAGPCSVTCGTGTKQAMRVCSSGHVEDCTGPSSKTEACAMTHCPDMLSWSVWFSGPCSVTCGTGTKHAVRSCSSGHVEDCTGPSNKTETCTKTACPVDGGWGSWLSWNQCSQTCVGGSRSRARVCNNPKPSLGGNNCHGDSQEHCVCNSHVCPVDGEWGDWGQWSSCTLTCGHGATKDRSRQCNNPTPQYGGKTCMGNALDSIGCPDVHCPVDGGWSTWDAWGACSQSCGTGSTRQRSRTCTYPRPMYGGAQCPGNHVMTENCPVVACPVDGQWSDWGQWSACPGACGTGTHLVSRYRHCNHPPPSHGGASCVGDGAQHKQCQSHPCPTPVNGGWSNWASWSSCTETCGISGLHIRDRLCDNPPTKNNGTECSGEYTNVKPCDPMRHCDVRGPSTGIRCLECTGVPRPDDCDMVTQCKEGSKCFVDQTVTQRGLVKFNLGCRTIQSCNAHKRGISGYGTMQQQLQHGGHSKRADLVLCQDCCNNKDFCNNQGCGQTVPPVSTRGLYCFECTAQSAGNACRRITECDLHQACFLTTRTYASTHEITTKCISSAQCLGVIKATIADALAMQTAGIVGKRDIRRPACCNTDFCNDYQQVTNGSSGGTTLDLDGQWSAWSPWSTCTRTCGPSVDKVRTRRCDNPPPRNNGHQCVGLNMDLEWCNTQDCPVVGNWLAWSDWSTCTATCGHGIKLRSRACDLPGKCHGDNSTILQCLARPAC